MTVTPLGRDQDCSLENREPDVLATWFLDPGGWSKSTVVGLFFIFPGICTLSLQLSQYLTLDFLIKKTDLTFELQHTMIDVYFKKMFPQEICEEEEIAGKGQNTPAEAWRRETHALYDYKRKGYKPSKPITTSLRSHNLRKQHYQQCIQIPKL
ncbi:hypothetical protein STEG23_017929, partial [Scotinomys teguina]